jgi:hypothetical protein
MCSSAGADRMNVWDYVDTVKHVVSEWKEIIKNFVAIEGHYNKILVTNATGCNPQK